MSTVHDLETAERHVRQGESHIDQQRRLLARLPDGSPLCEKAKRLLETFEQIQQQHLQHRDALRQALRDLNKRSATSGLR
jgi:hypothetical protein